jgi:hypothetical protein
MKMLYSHFLHNTEIRNAKSLLVFLLLFGGSQISNAQRKEIPVHQVDPRFTVSVYKSWGEGSEEYFFYIKNNTSDEFKMEVNVTLDLACVGQKSFVLGVNRIVQIKGGDNFGPDDDWVHAYTSGADNFKNCRIADGKSFTLFKDMTYSIGSIENITEKKEELEKRKKAEAREKELAEKKKAEDAAKEKKEREKVAKEKKDRDERIQKEKEENEEKDRKEKELAAIKSKEDKLKQETEDKKKSDLMTKYEKDKQELAEKNKNDKEKRDAEYEKNKKSPEELKKEIDGEIASQDWERKGDQAATTDPAYAQSCYEMASGLTTSLNNKDRIAKKIENLKSAYIAKGSADMLNAVGDLANQLDPKGKTTHSVSFLGYDGLGGDYKKLYTKYKQDPFSIDVIGYRFSAIFLALEMRIGYTNTPIYEYQVENNKSGPGIVVGRIGVQQQALSVGASGGLSFKLDKFIFYALYGADWMGPEVGKKLYSESKYTFVEDGVHFPDFIFRITGGIDYNIPKTRFGIGVNYNIKNIKTKPETNYVEIDHPNSSYTYYLNKIEAANYKFSQLGIRVIWRFN